jgi:pectate lyase
MPDNWEKANGLNPKDPKDGNAIGKDGYTNLENYLNGLAGSAATI